MISKSIFDNLDEESKYILNIVHKNGPLTKNELSTVYGYKLSTLTRFMQPLEEQKFIVQSSVGESTGGRRPVLYDVNPERYYIAGIDISRIYGQAVLLNLKMEVIDKYTFDMQTGLAPAETLNEIAAWIETSFGKLTDKNKILAGIGVGTVGPLDRSSGRILNAVNFSAKGWDEIHIGTYLKERFKVPVVADNGANASILAETCFGAGRGIKNVMYLNCGVGIRTAVISSGLFVRTINDAEDAFAHMVVNVDGNQCVCGKTGCIERYSSIHSIMEAFLQELRNSGSDFQQTQEGSITYLDICRAAKAGFAPAVKVLRNAAVILGTGLANFINLLNPQLVILSGPLIKQSELFYKECIEIAGKKSYQGKDNRIIFNRGGHFAEDAMSIGAAALVLESFLNLNNR